MSGLETLPSKSFPTKGLMSTTLVIVNDDIATFIFLQAYTHTMYTYQSLCTTLL